MNEPPPVKNLRMLLDRYAKARGLLAMAGDEAQRRRYRKLSQAALHEIERAFHLALLEQSKRTFTEAIRGRLTREQMEDWIQVIDEDLEALKAMSERNEV